ncbi:hypothetical protein ERJ75_001176200 [Trypanosoma vivax]|nr:hypothetical protein ERJ75_001176200 [Trypanosoma vivax]
MLASGRRCTGQARARRAPSSFSPRRVHARGAMRLDARARPNRLPLVLLRAAAYCVRTDLPGAPSAKRRAASDGGALQRPRPRVARRRPHSSSQAITSDARRKRVAASPVGDAPPASG